MVRIEQGRSLPPTGKQQLTFQIGQILRGQIIKSLKNQFATVNIGGVSYTAKLESPLQAGQHYWFQVKTQLPTLTLQLINPNKTAISPKDLSTIIKQLDIPDTELTKDILLYFSNHKLPISKETINTVIQILRDVSTEKGLPIIHRMIDQQFPIKASVFQSLLTYDQNPSFAALLTILEKRLLPYKNKIKPVGKLLTLLEQWPRVDQDQNVDSYHSLTPQSLFKILKSMGLNYERNIGAYLQHSEPIEDFSSLKPLLMDIKRTEGIPSEIKEIVSKAINHITGHQLHNISQGNLPIQLVYTFPIKINKDYIDLKLVWEGRKKTSGQLDPDHCRIIFYMTLHHLKETAIQLYVMQKQLSIQIYNEADITLTPLIKEFSPLLQEKLAKLNYKVSSISQVTKSPTYIQQHTTKQDMMDVKI